MREVTLKVKIKAPMASEVQKLERKSLVSYIYIGPPMNSAQYGTESRIQLNDVFAEVKDIPEYIEQERQARDEADRKLLTTSMKVNSETKMGVVSDVKQKLRKVNALKINYSTRKDSSKDKK